MNDEERDDQKKDQALLGGIGKKVKENNKSKFKMLAMRLATLRTCKITIASSSIAKFYNRFFTWWNNNNI